LNLRRFYSLDIAKSFIYCRQDKALPPGYFHPRMSSRLGAFKLLEMDGGHEVMFTRPRELADKLIEAAGNSKPKHMKTLSEHQAGNRDKTSDGSKECAANVAF
jgi:hypothetical protein